MHTQQSGQPVLVYYHVPEDKDEADMPNAFPVLKQGGGIRLQDIRAKFPLPGKYHFRFMMKLSGSSPALWMDVTNEDSTVPLFDGRIVAKVTRISWDHAPVSGAPPQAPQVSATPPVGDDSSPPPASRQHQAPAELLGFDDGPPARPAGGGAAPTRAAWPAQADLFRADVQQPRPRPPQPAANAKAPGKHDDFDMLFG